MPKDFLQIENISKSYGHKILFENIGFNISEGDKIALIAPNGTGKSTLLRILAGKDSSDSGGRILFLKDINIAFLDQDYHFDPELTIEQQIRKNAEPNTSDQNDFVREDFLQRMKETATGFNLGSLGRKMGELSGGEVKRVALTEMLAKNAEFLIMDEPTNHLDIEAIEFLESYLGRKRCTLLMVTHDRYFLDRVCNTIMEMDRGSIYTYQGNYQNYLEKRDERISNYNAETDKVRNLLRRELEWIHATPCARSGKAKYRIDAYHALAERASQTYVTREISMEGVSEVSRLGTKVIDCHNVELERSGKQLLKCFDYNFQRYEKVGVVGRNGIGKSSFTDMLAGDIEPSAGFLERGESLVIGYYKQKGISFNEEDTVLDTVADTRLLSRFLFPREMYNTRISKLSGGEKRRLYLLTVLMKNPNLLILDEPTNDLDIVTLNILEEYLIEFKGTLIIVSHDRHFMDRIADHLLVFTSGGEVKDFIGTFSEYRSFIKDSGNPRKPVSTGAKNTAAKSDASEIKVSTNNDSGTRKKTKLTWKEQRELESIEAELPQLAAEKHALEGLMSSGSLPYEELQKHGERIEWIMRRTDELEDRWLELSER